MRLLLFVALATLPCSFGTAQPGLTENQLKASFVLNFARYVEWPAGAFPHAEAPLTICMVGRDFRGLSLAELDGRRIGSRPVSVRSDVRLETIQGCHVAFIAESEERRLAPTLRGIGTRPILTVSDVENFIDAGGDIGLVSGGERLQFEVNREALASRQLRASSQMLRLARNLNHPVAKP
jgi:hypothetical protein